MNLRIFLSCIVISVSVIKVSVPDSFLFGADSGQHLENWPLCLAHNGPSSAHIHHLALLEYDSTKRKKEKRKSIAIIQLG